jgi:hypothetical protein
VPEDAGLLVTSKNCKALYTKKKAPVRSIEIPQSILIYILMCRTQIVCDTYNTRSAYARWKERLEQIQKNKKLGHTLSYEISKLVKRQVQKIKDENRVLKDENYVLNEVKKWLEKNGLTINDVSSKYYGLRQNKLKEVLGLIPDELIDDLERTRNKVNETIKRIRELDK